METIITVILIFAIAVVGAWITYRIFREKRPTVGPFRFVIAVSERKENGMDILTYKVGLPESPSGDVVKKVLTINRSTDADGKLEMVETIELDPKAETVDVEAAEGSQVDLSLIVIDNAGNPSTPPVLKTFQANDTVPPELTGEMTVEAASERTVPDDDEGDGEETPPAGDGDDGDDGDDGESDDPPAGD
ncbi:MAG: hypothetical protein KAV00_03515 [Phycisphaerae bacterium]|nr:hypothetical protein [Phycisphaerae bacterium]